MKLIPWLLIILTLPVAARSQDEPPEHVHDAVTALEDLLDSEGDEAISRFIDDAMVPRAGDSRAALEDGLRRLREEARAYFDDVAVQPDPDGILMVLASGKGQLTLKVAIEPEGISGIEVFDGEPVEGLDLTLENLDETFDELESRGLGGVVYVRMDGEVVVKRAFGMAHQDLGVPNHLDTVFGTGSRPIDYTKAAILLLDQRGELALDDPIDQHIPEVPADKRTMTLRHLMNGQSGLPDFFETADDWNPDLAWVDRETAERRMMAQTLLFPPGEGREHSHGAFGLLAAVVERVSGTTYYQFIREHLLDPAGMTRTGEYGEARGMDLADFAEGAGPERVGVPNIPPNWGPTSWLVRGSGGMYSTLEDQLKFYAFVAGSGVLDDEHAVLFRQPTVTLDGSSRGFEVFRASVPPGTDVHLFANAWDDRSDLHQLIQGLEALVEFGE